MTFDPNIHHRKTIRLPEYDYSNQGYYFITICTQNHKNYFGKIENDIMQLNQLGEIIQNQWLNLNNRYYNIKTKDYVIMPNHIHGIININDNPVGAPLAGAQNRDKINSNQIIRESSLTKQIPGHPQGDAPTVGDLVGTFKSFCVNDWLKYIKQNNVDALGKFWQRNYYEHIIRTENSYNEISKYIQTNQLNWKKDKLFN
jgi:REP element-mobilizing transposase RayT